MCMRLRRFGFLASCSSFPHNILMGSVLMCALLTCALLSAPVAAQSGSGRTIPKRIVGDYGYWSKYQTPAYGHAQIPYNMLTQINHAGISFGDDGGLSVPNGFIEPELNDLSHAAGVKVLLLLDGDFTGLEASGKLKNLVDNIAAFAQEYNYDGVDMDWEYPATPQDRAFFVQMMAELRESNPNYVLSIDVPPWGGLAYDVKALQQSIDQFNIMMYDCAGPWTDDGQLNSPIFWDYSDPQPYECNPGGSADQAATTFLKDIPAAQLNMGTPFYGYIYTIINQLFETCPNTVIPPVTADGNCDDTTVFTVNYGPDIKPHINRDGWYRTYDPVALVPYLLQKDGNNGFVTYDDAYSTYTRVWYSDWDRGLGGTFMWSLDADYDGHSQDLLGAMYAATMAAPQAPPQ